MASSLARRLAEPQTTIESGTVIATGPRVEVRLSAGAFPARRAKSCLVAPDLGDRVLCAVEPDAVFVLAVLEGDEDVTITVDGDLDLEARGGRVAVKSPEGVDIVSGGEVAITSVDLSMRAKRSAVAVDELGFVGRLVSAKAGKFALFADEVDSVLTRMTQRAKRIFRFVDELDQTRAGAIDMRAQSVVGIRGENTLISARLVAKVDGEQIHLG
jgi:hypothetical protein